MARIGIFQETIVPHVEEINFFEVELPGFPVDFITAPLEFSIFCINLARNPRFFSQILAYPLEFQLLLLYTPGISIDILNRGVTFIFWKSQFEQEIVIQVHDRYIYTADR